MWNYRRTFHRRQVHIVKAHLIEPEFSKRTKQWNSCECWRIDLLTYWIRSILTEGFHFSQLRIKRICLCSDLLTFIQHTRNSNKEWKSWNCRKTSLLPHRTRSNLRGLFHPKLVKILKTYPVEFEDGTRRKSMKFMEMLKTNILTHWIPWSVTRRFHVPQFKIVKILPARIGTFIEHSKRRKRKWNSWNRWRTNHLTHWTNSILRTKFHLQEDKTIRSHLMDPTHSLSILNKRIKSGIIEEQVFSAHWKHSTEEKDSTYDKLRLSQHIGWKFNILEGENSEIHATVEEHVFSLTEHIGIWEENSIKTD